MSIAPNNATGIDVDFTFFDIEANYDYLYIYDGPDIIKGMNKIQWVTADHVPFTVRNIGPLFINDSFNDESLIDVEGFAENACKSLSLNQLFQFIRDGFCKTDQARNNLAIRTHK